MSIFDLHATVLTDYRDFVRSFFDIADPRARAFIDHALEDERHLWPDFLLQVSPSYARVATVDDLASRGVLHEETARVFRTPRTEAIPPLPASVRSAATRVQSGKLRRHQRHRLGQEPDLFPADHRQPAPATRTPGDRVAALVVYPMNALVNSQLEALKKLKERYERRYRTPFPVTFAKYTGDSQEADKSRASPAPAADHADQLRDGRTDAGAAGGSAIPGPGRWRLAVPGLRRIAHLPWPPGRRRGHAHPATQGALRGARFGARRHQRHHGGQPRCVPRCSGGLRSRISRSGSSAIP